MQYSIFTKPWPDRPVAELGAMARGLGFDAIEFPLRPGFQLEPQHAEKGLKELCHQLADCGVGVTSVASAATEAVFAGCANAGVPLIRVMAMFDITGASYTQAEAAFRRELEAVVPLCERYGVTVGVQQHFGPGVFNTMELLHLLEGFDPRHIGAIWDAGHSGLSGEDPRQALDIIWEKLCLVNFKSAYYRRVNGPEAQRAQFEPYFTTGRNGNSDWGVALGYLKERGYKGVLCMPAEYTDEHNVLPYIAEDIAYLKALERQV